MTTFLLCVFVVIAILLILVVLVQRGRGGGLSGAFGSGGGSTSAFGTKTGDVFTTVTVVLFVVFMLMAIWLNMHIRDKKEDIAGGVHEGPVVGPETPAPASAPAGGGLLVTPGTSTSLPTSLPALVGPPTTPPGLSIAPPFATTMPAPMPTTLPATSTTLPK